MENQQFILDILETAINALRAKTDRDCQLVISNLLSLKDSCLIGQEQLEQHCQVNYVVTMQMKELLQKQVAKAETQQPIGFTANIAK